MSEIGGMNIQKLVENYGTPLVVYDETSLRGKLKSFTDHFKSDSFETDVIYASKAFNCKAMISLVEEYGCCLDVVSGGELYTAYKAGYDCSRIFFRIYYNCRYIFGSPYKVAFKRNSKLGIKDYSYGIPSSIQPAI